ncbi:MAG: sigma-54 dependent transcriptional regulator [Treponema sp.]|nr:sigma-54 dependent transcriptional regulator [Treponema sp.]
MKYRLLIADDEKNIREGLAASLEMEGFETVCVQDGNEAWERFGKGDIDLDITDLRMPGMGGEELLRRITSEAPGFPVIILTGHGTVDNAVKAMHNGAYDFLTKPFNLDRLSLLAKRALENRELVMQNQMMAEERDREKKNIAGTGASPAMRKVFAAVEQVAPTKASILITGESGVGKELVADAIHDLSPRREKPLIKVHCAALSASLLESELFGHEKGAFTGAVARKRGRFELANEGTLFLDEIGEIDQNIQIKLLRVLQEKKFERVGGEETVETDVRIVAATNKDLKEEIAKGNFREDLYFRLNVVNIHVPPLRERKDDIPLLTTVFLNELARENNKKISGINEKARARLLAYDWPGNVRELRNCIESAVVMSKGPQITEDDLPATLHSPDDGGWIRIPRGTPLDESEKWIIQDTLSFCKGNKSKAAETLGISRKTLHRKLLDWKLEDSQSE